MIPKQRESILRQLAKTEGDSAQAALEKEAAKLMDILQTETDYDELDLCLEYFSAIAYRVHEKVAIALSAFLVRLESIDLSYAKIEGYPIERRKEYQNNTSLAVKVIKHLEDIRYYEIERVFEVLLKYSIDKNEAISKQANASLVELAKYDLTVFYGNGKNWHGMGPLPQEKILQKLTSLNAEEKITFFHVINNLCHQILSVEMSGTKWTSTSVVLSTGSVPAINDIQDIRRGSIKLLEDLYALADTVNKKRLILSSLMTATRRSHHGKNEGTDQMVDENTIQVMGFIKSIISDENLEVIQKLEHDVYYLHRRFEKPELIAIALEIRAMIDSNYEYQIFKILIGFEGVFSEWGPKDIDARDFEKERKLREKNAKAFALSMNDNNYNIWKNRIIEYASIQSEDLATFPYFSKFLEALGKEKPNIGMRLLLEEASHIDRFLIPVMIGLWDTDQRDALTKLLNKWVSKETHLFSIARFLGFTKPINEDLLEAIFNIARKRKDVATLIYVISAISNQYSDNTKHLVSKFFIPAVKILTDLKNHNWVYDFWFRGQKEQIFNDMSDEDRQAVLKNLLGVNDVSYEIEGILAEIAEYNPQLVIQFFCDRMDLEKEKRQQENRSKEERYEAIPYSFYELSRPLSKIPKEAVDAVYKNYDGKYAYFMFKGARLLKNIFSDFPLSFSQRLSSILSLNDEKSILFVLGILRAYDGLPDIQGLCKEIIELLPIDSKYLNEVMIALESTGVVAGEFGFVELYKTRKLEIEHWLNDDNEKVRIFAAKYIKILEGQIVSEQKRAEESILLRRHDYGEDEA